MILFIVCFFYDSKVMILFYRSVIYLFILQKESGSEKSLDGDPDHPGSGGPAGLGEDPLQYPHHPAPVYPGLSQ